MLIDDLDRRIVALLDERTCVVEKIGRVKREAQLPISNPRREEQVFANITEANQGPLAEGRYGASSNASSTRCAPSSVCGWSSRGDKMTNDSRNAGRRNRAQIQGVIDRLVELGFDVHRSTGMIHTVLGGVGGKDEFDVAVFEVMDGVKDAHRIASPYKLASRGFRPGGTIVEIGGVEIGGRTGGDDGRSVQRGEPGPDRPNARSWSPRPERR